MVIVLYWHREKVVGHYAGVQGREPTVSIRTQREGDKNEK